MHIVGLGGTARPGSSSEQALQIAMRAVAARGASTRVFGGEELARLPMYSPEQDFRTPLARKYIEHLRAASGIIVSSPGYHGSMSGLVKNALDFTEDLRDDPRPYFADRSVGVIVTAHGWQAAVTALEALRSVVHALRGWVTPYGAAINSSECTFVDGRCDQTRVEAQLELVSAEVVRFARLVADDRDEYGPAQTRRFQAVGS